MRLFFCVALCMLAHYGFGFQSMINEKCKIPLLNFLDLEIPTMTITISKDEKSHEPPKICKQCTHYRPAIFKEQYDVGNHAASCSKFREMNLVNGDYEFINVLEARKSPKYCGKEGKYFEHRVNRMVQVNGYDDDDDNNDKN
jgi:hypothetical protein